MYMHWQQKQNFNEVENLYFHIQHQQVLAQNSAQAGKENEWRDSELRIRATEEDEVRTSI